MKIAITGASGFIGQLLLPKLIKAKVEIVLIGRDAKKLNDLFPKIPSYDYTNLSSAIENTDLLLHLAVVNSNSKLREDEFNKINIDLLLDVAKIAREAGVKRFINTSSIHCLQNKNTHYANSKRDAIRALSKLKWTAVENIYLATVYGNRWNGKMSVLNRLPLCLAKLIFLLVSAVKPTLNIDRFADYILSSNKPQNQQFPIILCDDKSLNPFYNWLKR